MDFDPRWNDDPRDDDHRDDLRREESGRELNQGSRGISSDPLERDARDPRDVFTRDLDLPRGPRPSMRVNPVAPASRAESNPSADR